MKKLKITKKTYINLFMMFVMCILCGCDYNAVRTEELKTTIEQAYFEGQKDALTGDVRIRKNVDGCWMWTKSCWNSGLYPTFNPSILCEEK